MGKITIQLLIVLVLGMLLVGCGEGKMQRFEEKENDVLDKNKVISKKKRSKDTVYAKYGEIELNQIFKEGAYLYWAEDESIKISQPWDGLLVHWNNEKGDYKIEYYNEAHQLEKIIDLWKITPYTKENYPLLSDKMGFNSEYESISKGIQDDITYDFRKNVTEYRTRVTALPQSSGHTAHNKHIILQYDLIPIHKDIVIGWVTTLVVFDSLGNEVSRLDDIEFDVSHPIVTRDGRYMAFNYGETMDNDFSFLRKHEGIRIYDLNTKKVIYEDTGQRGLDPVFMGLTETKNGFIKITKRDARRDKSIVFERVLIDCLNKVKYSKKLSKEDHENLSIIFSKLDGSYDKIVKTLNFKKETF